MKVSKKKVNNIIKNNYYFIVVLAVLIITVVSILIINNNLTKKEKIAFDIVSNVKSQFKNPDGVKIVSAKICGEDYGIVRISSTNSFGGIVTDDYYINKETLSLGTSHEAAGVVDECFAMEEKDYDSVYVLSSNSISKINKKLKGAN